MRKIGRPIKEKNLSSELEAEKKNKRVPLTEEQKVAKEKAKMEKAKAKIANFRRLADFRLKKISKAAEQLMFLSNTSIYTYNEGQIQYIMKKLTSIIQSVDNAFRVTTPEKELIEVPE